MMKDSADSNAKARITIVAVVAPFFEKRGSIGGFAIRALRGVIPANPRQMAYAIIFCGKKLINFNDIHDNAPFFLAYLGTLNHSQNGLSRKKLLP